MQTYDQQTVSSESFDLFVIGGGINGCGIARDAAGRGLSVGLAERDDLGGATSSASTKLFHGGLRYLEYFEFRLVRHALAERETLLRAMPHISWPLRFILPLHPDMRFPVETPASRVLARVLPWMKGRRPAWLIRFGLFLYDRLGGREILPGTRSLDLGSSVEGAPLKPIYSKAFEYSDCWVEDSRLVVLNARDAERRGATILARTAVLSAARVNGIWTISLRDSLDGSIRNAQARVLVNAAGPWVGDVVQNRLRLDSPESVRLVRGSHIVIRKLYDHDKCYFFQGEDGRIAFAIPYETDFTLIGTTDAVHRDLEEPPRCSTAEMRYLINFANMYFAKAISETDIVWSYSGVRPLYEDGATSASAATRDYVLSLDRGGGVPVLNVFGGKLTTYRCLAEEALERLRPFLPGMKGGWTAGAPLPGGDFPVDGFAELRDDLRRCYPFLTEAWANRLVRAYGTEAREVLGSAGSAEELGENFAATLTAAEVYWLMDREYAHTAEDVVWRRSKLGLRLSAVEITALDTWMKAEIKRRPKRRCHRKNAETA